MCMHAYITTFLTGFQEQEVIYEFKIQLWPFQTCRDFIVSLQEVTVIQYENIIIIH